MDTIRLGEVEVSAKDLLNTKEALRKAKDELQIKVDERTADLKKINEKLGLEISERKRSEQALGEARDELERRVEERTAEITKANKELEAEITERKRADKNNY